MGCGAGALDVASKTLTFDDCVLLGVGGIGSIEEWRKRMDEAYERRIVAILKTIARQDMTVSLKRSAMKGVQFAVASITGSDLVTSSEWVASVKDAARSSLKDYVVEKYGVRGGLGEDEKIRALADLNLAALILAGDEDVGRLRGEAESECDPILVEGCKDVSGEELFRSFHLGCSFVYGSMSPADRARGGERKQVCGECERFVDIFNAAREDDEDLGIVRRDKAEERSKPGAGLVGGFVRSFLG